MTLTLFDFSLDIPNQGKSLQAFLSVKAAQNDQGFPLTRHAILSFLKDAQIVFGILDYAIEKIIERGSAQNELIAHGLAPLKGSDCQFQLLAYEQHQAYEELFQNLPHLSDTKSLENLNDLILSPQAPLLRRLLACPGAPGKNIFGQLIPGIKGAERPFPVFRRAQISPQDPHLLVSMIEGIPVLHLPFLIEMVPITILRRDLVDSKYFQGVVVILGNIPDYVRVQAQSDILVLGTVDAAVLISGRRIWIRQGVKGKDLAVLRAESDITLRFAEHATLEAGGDLKAVSLHHCYSVALGRLEAHYILGGVARSSMTLSVNQAGSAGVETSLCSGQNSYLDTAIQELQDRITRIQLQLQDIQLELSSKAMFNSEQNQVLKIPAVFMTFAN